MSIKDTEVSCKYVEWVEVQKEEDSRFGVGRRVNKMLQ